MVVVSLQCPPAQDMVKKMASTSTSVRFCFSKNGDNAK